ncbi:NB-ARC domain-containing protein [Allokutzneria sp. NRRL B-24872]|uniref:NB-ARC domain-containing protein n=1 Tax=Allokutzneria sp. NRRL B-24872 TaxID=1137961 RepID=UPI000A38AB63|nr:NB-ARC domain-containing protein [Allokutzneria sp. NRRL B-24872]
MSGSPPPTAWGLPPRQPGFVNREAERAWFRGHLEAPREGAPLVALVSGPQGSGKTALLVECGNEADFDAVLFADLDDYRHDEVADYGGVLGDLLVQLGIGREWVAPSLPARKDQYRQSSAHRRVLVLLDNVKLHDDISPLVPSSARSAVLVASHWQLDHVLSRGAENLSLTELSPEHAMQLLAWFCPQDRLDREPDAVAELIAKCGRLPLPLRTVGARLRKHPAHEIARLVRALDGGKLFVDLFDVPYSQLSGEARRLYELLPLHPGTAWTEDSAEALLGTSAADALDEVVEASLVIEDRTGRYRFLGPVREHASRASGNLSQDDREAAIRRLTDFFASRAQFADRAGKDRLRLTEPSGANPFARDAVAGLDWLESERTTLVGIAAIALRHSWFEQVVAIAESMFALHMNRPHQLVWEELDALGLEAARRWGNREAEARMLSQRARFDLDHGDQDAALVGIEEARALAEASTNLRLQGSVWELTGRVLFERGEYEASRRAYERFLEIAKGIGAAPQAIATHYLGRLAALDGRTEEASLLLHAALPLARQGEGDPRTEARVMESLSEVDGDPRPWLLKAVEIYRARGMLKYEAGVLVRLIALAESRADTASVRVHLERLLEVYEASKHPDVASLRSRLDEP